jgi:hypothetical protein
MRLLLLFLLPLAIRETEYCNEAVRESSKSIDTINVIVTSYNPQISQCDSTPYLTASMNVIDTNLLKINKIRWVALSRNLLKRWGGKYKYNDSIDIPSLGKYRVVDCMNKRFKNRIDILTYSSVLQPFKTKIVY